MSKLRDWLKVTPSKRNLDEILTGYSDEDKIRIIYNLVDAWKHNQKNVKMQGVSIIEFDAITVKDLEKYFESAEKKLKKEGISDPTIMDIAIEFLKQKSLLSSKPEHKEEKNTSFYIDGFMFYLPENLRETIMNLLREKGGFERAIIDGKLCDTPSVELEQAARHQMNGRVIGMREIKIFLRNKGVNLATILESDNLRSVD